MADINISQAAYVRYTVEAPLPSTLTDLEQYVTAAYQHFQANGNGATVEPDTFTIEGDQAGLTIGWLLPAAAPATTPQQVVAPSASPTATAPFSTISDVPDGDAQ